MSAPHTSHILRRALRLRCPRCGDGPLFRGLVQMHDECPACGLSFRREPGFYLGSIYLNYGATVIVTGLLYVQEDPVDLHESQNTVAVPLNSLGDDALVPGSAALAGFNARMR